jgi:hypothetical protein
MSRSLPVQKKIEISNPKKLFVETGGQVNVYMSRTGAPKRMLELGPSIVLRDETGRRIAEATWRELEAGSNQNDHLKRGRFDDRPYLQPRAAQSWRCSGVTRLRARRSRTA